MGAGGRDNDKEKTEETALPPAYQEKEPLPPDNPSQDPEAPVDPPVITQPDHRCCKKKRGKGRCCCYCCGFLVMLILCCTVMPMVIVYLTRDLWTRPYVDIRFYGKTSHVTSETLKAGREITIQCHVDMGSKYLPLVQWFHDPNEDSDDGTTGYRMFGVHNQIHDPAYKDRFEVVKTETTSHRVTYNLKIKDLQPQDAGRYACQVPKVSHHQRDGTVDEYQLKSRSSSSSSSSEDSDDNDDDKKKKHHGCWWSHRRNDYIYLGVTK